MKCYHPSFFQKEPRRKVNDLKFYLRAYLLLRNRQFGKFFLYSLLFFAPQLWNQFPLHHLPHQTQPEKIVKFAPLSKCALPICLVLPSPDDTPHSPKDRREIWHIPDDL